MMEAQESVDRAVECFNGFEFSRRTLVANTARPRENCQLSTEQLLAVLRDA